MRILICGSRSLKSILDVQLAVKASEFLPITEIVTGGAPGIDTVADRWAHDNRIDRTVMYANWGGRGKSAGYHRNERMVDYVDAVIAIWDGKSKGTAHTVQVAKNKGKPCYIYCAQPVRDLDKI